MEAILFIFGLAIGSFLNTLIDRIPERKTILGRSYCDSCKKTLRWFELFPLVSFLFLKGRCGRCKNLISIRNPLVELLTALLFLFSYSFLGTNLVAFLYLLFIESCLIVIFFIDLKQGIIPDVITYPAIVVSLFYHISDQSLLPNYFISALASGSFFLLLFLLTRGRGMGFGDVKLAFLLGLFLGFPNIVLALYLAFLTGAFVSLILIVKGLKKIKSTIAFGPFLVANSLVVLFAGEKIMRLFPFL